MIKGLESMMKAAIKSKYLKITGKFFLIVAVLVISALFIFSFTSCCNLSSLADQFIKTRISGEGNSTNNDSINNGSQGPKGDAAVEEETSSKDSTETVASGTTSGSSDTSGSGSTAGAQENMALLILKSQAVPNPCILNTG